MPVFHARWSGIKTFRKCQKLYEYAWLQNIERKKPIVPLVRGSIIGECLDKLAAKKGIAPVIKKYETEYGKLFKAEQEEYGDILGECERIVHNYKRLYANDGLVYLKGKDGNPFEVEVETDFSIGSIKVHFTGHIDKLVKDKEGHILVLDHKSHKSIPGPDARYNDFQLLTYLWLLPLSGLPKADGVLWDYLRTKPPTVPELLKKGGLTRRANLDSDYDTYMAAIQENGLNPEDYKDELARFKAEGGNRYFERVRLPAPGPVLIENMVSDFKETIIQIVDATKKGKFVRNMGRDCGSCGFYQLCQMELRGHDTEFVRKSSYRQRPEK